MRKAYKNIIALSVVLIAGLTIVVPVFAQDPFSTIAVGGLGGASGAGLFGSMASSSGINIDWGNNTADGMDAMWNKLNPDNVYFSGEKHEATNVGEDVFDYIQVDIGDWLSAQSDFIVAFAQENGVDDNDQGSIGGQLNFNGIPATDQFGGYLYSAPLGSYYIDTYTSGNTYVYSAYGITGTITTQGHRTVQYSINTGVQTAGGVKAYNNPGIYELRLYFNAGNVYACFKFETDNIWSWDYALAGQSTTSNTVNWTSNTVNTGVFNGWESAKVKIPSSISQLQTGWTLTDFLNELDRIWYGAGQDSIIIEDGSQDPPVPPVPVPDTPLGEVPFDDWVDLWGQGIYQQLENQSDALDLIGSNGTDAVEELESIDTNTEELVEVAESIDTNIGIGNGILGGIRSLAQSTVNYLEGIAEHVGELVEEIVKGTETLIAGILNQIPSVFGVIFGPIKLASSIWHYVVEWIQSISAPMSWIWSMASGTSYNIILPVYASLAGAVVLAFYKRFGK